MEQPSGELRSFALEVVRRLREAGHEAFWAGGCVRDLLIETTPKDYDVATSARPEEVGRLFRRTLAVGASFGVIQVLGRQGLAVEVATFRTDADYSDGRHPDAVHFTTAREDALRRDFTINGMFYDPLAEKVFDHVGGQEDLRAGRIRSIGDPHRRIAEDKLRMLRAVRFAARLGFEIEPQTAEAVQNMARELGVVSAERIMMELRTMLIPPSRISALELLRQLRLFEQVFPEIAEPLADEAVWQRTLAGCQLGERELSLPVVMAGLLATGSDSEAPADAESIFRRLKGPNDERVRTVWIVTHRHDFDNARNTPMSLLKRRFAHPACEELLLHHEAIVIASKGSDPDAAYCRELLASLSPEEIDPAPLITGGDLIDLGLNPSPRFAEILERIRDEQLEGKLTNKKEALGYLESIFEEDSSPENS